MSTSSFQSASNLCSEINNVCDLGICKLVLNSCRKSSFSFMFFSVIHITLFKPWNSRSPLFPFSCKILRQKLLKCFINCFQRWLKSSLGNIGKHEARKSRSLLSSSLGTISSFTTLASFTRNKNQIG